MIDEAVFTREDVRGSLLQLAAGAVEALHYMAIPGDPAVLRALVDEQAAAIGLNVLIRDTTDKFVAIRPDDLIVMRFDDYADAWGLPA